MTISGLSRADFRNKAFDIVRTLVCMTTATTAKGQRWHRAEGALMCIGARAINVRDSIVNDHDRFHVDPVRSQFTGSRALRCDAAGSSALTPPLLSPPSVSVITTRLNRLPFFRRLAPLILLRSPTGGAAPEQHPIPSLIERRARTPFPLRRIPLHRPSVRLKQAA